jgi:hypothetical protein
LEDRRIQEEELVSSHSKPDPGGQSVKGSLQSF